VLAPGLPDGEPAGEVAGLTDAAGPGVGDAGGLTSGVFVHAANATADAAKTDNRMDLLTLLMFICHGQSRLLATE
jgi:hypothetical protein